MRTGASYVLIALGGLLLAGCDSRPDVATYTVPKDATAVPATAPAAQQGEMRAMPGMAESVANVHQPEWRAPEGWQPQQLDAIRRGAWRVSGTGGAQAEVTVTVFPGNVGGLLLNVNRWRGQIGLGDITEAELSQVVVNRVLGKENSQVVTLINPDNGRASITALVPHDGATWFFKILGDSSVIGAQSAQWESFLQSIHFAGH